MGVLMAAAMVDTYVPLFGQRLAHLTPVAAGFLGAALALGWTVSEIVSASLENPRTIGRVIVAAPMVVASGLALGAVAQRDNASAGIVAAVGARAARGRHRDRDGLAASVGARDGFRRRSGRGRRRGRGDQHGPARSPGRSAPAWPASSSTRPRGGDVMAARWLFTVFTVLCAAGVVASYRAVRGNR